MKETRSWLNALVTLTQLKGTHDFHRHPCYQLHQGHAPPKKLKKFQILETIDPTLEEAMPDAVPATKPTPLKNQTVFTIPSKKTTHHNKLQITELSGFEKFETRTSIKYNRAAAAPTSLT